MLSERQKLILSAIVDDYIRFAEPVGSRSISKRGDVGFSPATIRNEMSDLEEMGYLEQPHTSAGRIPSQKGYRYYVDRLLNTLGSNQQELDSMKLYFVEKINEMEHIIQHAASILSNLTNYTSIVMGPELFNTTLKHMQLIPLNNESAVVIIVTNTGHVENKVVHIPEGTPIQELEKVIAILNAKLSGVPLLQFRSMLFNEVASEMRKHVTRCEELIGWVDQMMDADKEDRIFLSGTTNMLTQPEFKDVEKVKTILDLLDQTPTLIQIFSDAPEGIQVKIGAENNLEAIRNCSLITATYSVDGQALGTIGVLGPTRMEYAKVISILNQLSGGLTSAFSRWYK